MAKTSLLTNPSKLICCILLYAALSIFVFSQIAAASSLTKAFKVNSSLAEGTVVSLEDDGTTAVPASRDNMAGLYGVVTSSGDLSVARANEDAQTVQVAKDGVINTLVSTYQGDIKSGDPITVNALEGVGEKAIASGKIIGIAQADFNGESTDSKEFSVATSNGTKSVRVGAIPVKVEVQLYSIASSGQGSLNENRNKALQLADSLTGQTVKPYALVIAGILLLFGVFIAGFLVISSGYASMISLGRNPIAKRVILVSLLKVLMIAAAICFVAAAFAYLILIIV